MRERLRRWRETWVFQVVRWTGYRVLRWEVALHVSQDGRQLRVTTIVLGD